MHDAELAELVDLDYGAFDDDLAFYESLARRTGGPILELGAGTGRLAIALARAGYDVVALDHSAAMLERARCKAGAGLERLQLIESDMRDFDLRRLAKASPAEFALAYAGYGAFHHLLTPEDQLACLRCVERHLLSDGLFVFDLRPIFATDWEAADSVPLLHDWTRTLPNGDSVTKLRAVHVERARQVQHETHYYDRVAADGPLRRVTTSVDLRFSTRYEIEGLLREAGLELEQVYGDFELAPYGDDSEYMITSARRQTGK
jgi:SAM-dependent methyltransferase